MPCTLNCGLKIRYTDLALHIENECSRRFTLNNNQNSTSRGSSCSSSRGKGDRSSSSNSNSNSNSNSYEGSLSSNTKKLKDHEDGEDNIVKSKP
jgi:hypothetical protein